MLHGFRLLALLVFPAMAWAEPATPLEINAGERLLVLAPHPDDEVLGAGGITQRVIAQSGSAHIGIVTAGDGYVEAVQREYHTPHPSFTSYLHYGSTRLAEAQQAAQALGRGRIHLELLGFPDGGLQPLLDTHWERGHPERSPTTGVSAVPYPEARVPQRAYDGSDLRAELLRLLREVRPTLVVLPDPLDRHPDHAALGLFALLALHDWMGVEDTQAQIAQPGGAKHWPRLLAYLIHWDKTWPEGAHNHMTQDLSETALGLPADLPRRSHPSVCLTLDRHERQIKRAALAQYRTQQRAMGPYLAAFVRTTECLSVLAPQDAQDAANALLERVRYRNSL